ncbi:nSTAND1 domain-containing NTPase [Micromonospora antibiotica]|uniref:WD40 repeat n=1 Tax=Micromonospora antibiotica TaxID=2807623 RepID=A0ABS3V6Y8_9ACTN|nr:WD40 repeat domain-containing protein [Micromonospora antibiotica]MBO4161380.1 hypothetical protein [Micromonospora antibiotica]
MTKSVVANTAASGPGPVNTPKDFGRELTEIRNRAGLSIQLVVDKIQNGNKFKEGASRGTLGDWFAGRSVPSARLENTLVDLLRACGIKDQAEIDQWVAVCRRLRLTPGPRPAGVEPYRGLFSFDTEHADWFFGRDALTRKLVELIVQTDAAGGGIRMVVGASGAGKSSLLRAGVIPALRVGGGDDLGRSWQVVCFTPQARPVDELAKRLAKLAGSVKAEEVAEALREDPERCAEYVRLAMKDRDQTANEQAVNDSDGFASGNGLAIIVDQFEEAFTTCDKEDERRDFIAALRAAAAGPLGAVVVIGLRADFYAQALRHPQLLAAVQGGQFTVGPMSEAELREAIVQPACKAKIHYEAGLVELLLQEVRPRGSKRDPQRAHDAGVLPLLSHALQETLKHGHGRQLTIADYQAVGGIYKAVADSADKIYDKELKTTTQQDLARRLFLNLVHIGAETADTRRRVSTAELFADHGDGAQRDDLEAVLVPFVRDRLVTVHADMVEISHDALLSAWPTLGKWLDADRPGLVVARNLNEAATAWDRDGRNSSDLYQATRLEAAQDWARHHRRELPRLTLDFLDSSRRYARRRRWFRQVVIATIVLIAAVAVVQNFRLDEQNLSIVSQQLAAQAHGVAAANPRASALLALAAWDTHKTPQSRGAVLSLQNHPLAVVDSGRTNTFVSIASSDDGTVDAAVAADGRLMLRNGEDQPWQELPSRVGEVRRIAFGANTTLAASGQRGVQIWTDPWHKPAGQVVSNDAAYVSGLAFAGKDRSTLYTSNTNGVIERWRTDGKPAGPAIPTPIRLTSVAAQRCDGDWDENECLVAFGVNDGTVQLRYADSGALRRKQLAPREQGMPIYNLAFSPDGDSLAVASADQRIHLWSVSQNSEIGSIDAHNQPIPHLVFAPGPGCLPPPSNRSTSEMSTSGTACVLATVGYDAVRVWNIRRDAPGVTALQLLFRLESQGQVPTSAAFADRAGTLLTTYDDGSLVQWDVGRITVEGAVNDLAFDPTPDAKAGMTIVDGGGHINLRPKDGSESASLRTQTRARNYVSVAYGPNSKRWAAAGDDHRVYVSSSAYNQPYLPAAPQFPASSDEAVDINRVVFGTDGTLYTGDSAGHVKRWTVNEERGLTKADFSGELNTGDAISGRFAVFSMAVSEDRSVLAATFTDGTVRLWDTATGDLLLNPINASTAAVHSITFAPGQATFFTGDANGVIRRWNTKSGKQIGGDATGHSGPVASLTVSENGRTLVSASHDHTIRLWSVAAGEAPEFYADLIGHTDKVNTVVFRPGTNELYSGSDDRSVLIWNLDLNDAHRRACATSRDDISKKKAWERLAPGLNRSDHQHMCD